MTEDITADLHGSPHLLIAFMDEHEEFAHVGEAAMSLAKGSGARIILYDRDAASGWGDPLPTWWSAAGERAQYGDPLSEAELSKLGFGVLARTVAAARAEGVDAWGWLPAEHGTNHAVDYARRHGADAVLLPAELDEPGLVDRLRRQTVDEALRTAEEATDSPAICSSTATARSDRRAVHSTTNRSHETPEQGQISSWRGAMDAVGRRPGGRLGPELVPKPVAGGAFTVACKADPERATRSREDPSRAAWGLRRGPVRPPARRGGRPGGRCRDPTRPEGHRFAPRPRRAAGGRDPSVKGGVHEQAGRHPPATVAVAAAA